MIGYAIDGIVFYYIHSKHNYPGTVSGDNTFKYHRKHHMKKIGFIGGLGPTSTVLFYQKLIHYGQSAYGKNPEIFIHSVELQKCLKLIQSGEYHALADLFEDVLDALRRAGAEITFLSSISMHRVLPFFTRWQASIFNIFRTTVSSIVEPKVLLLGTKYIVRSEYFRNALRELDKFIITPSADDIDTIEIIIKEELNNGDVNEGSKNNVLDIIQKSISTENTAVLLACTALPRLIRASDLRATVYDPIDICCRYMTGNL